MKKTIALILVLSVFLSCEKDDICSSEVSTTAKLVLRFYDITDQDETKAVPNLLVYGLNDLIILDYLPQLQIP